MTATTRLPLGQMVWGRLQKRLDDTRRWRVVWRYYTTVLGHQPYVCSGMSLPIGTWAA
jgi:hypothetical protein